MSNSKEFDVVERTCLNMLMYYSDIHQIGISQRRTLFDNGFIDKVIHKRKHPIELTAYGRKQLKSAKLSEFHTARMRTPEARAQVSEHFKALWQDPEYKKRTSDAIRKGHLALWDKPGDRESRIAGAKKAWVNRRIKFGPNGFSDKPRKKRFKTDRDKARSGERIRWGYAWKRLAETIQTIFYPKKYQCPLCHFHTEHERGVSLHIGRMHKEKRD